MAKICENDASSINLNRSVSSLTMSSRDDVLVFSFLSSDISCSLSFVAVVIHRKIKGRFRKRAVLANVLSFRFWGSRII